MTVWSTAEDERRIAYVWELASAQQLEQAGWRLLDHTTFRVLTGELWRFELPEELDLWVHSPLECQIAAQRVLLRMQNGRPFGAS
ncbi:MAG TPA: hypothetical protein VMV93_04520 [Chloroflexota bacterium]|nr:hypothetical protein [Chloroflexota bacterium]